MTNRWHTTLLLAVAGVIISSATVVQPGDPKPKVDPGPQYAADGSLKRPTGFQTWMFVGANIGLQYRKDAVETTQREKDRRKDGDIGDFHNVYINPEAYEHYRRTGKFPDETVLVMDVYQAKEREPQNIVAKGFFPGDRKEIEVAVKNSNRPDGSKTDWAYYVFPKNQATAKAFPDSACYQCHKKHADDDNVWVQFYPTLRALKKPKTK